MKFIRHAEGKTATRFLIGLPPNANFKNRASRRAKRHGPQLFHSELDSCYSRIFCLNRKLSTVLMNTIPARSAISVA